MKRSLVLTCLIVIGSLLILSGSAGAITLYAPDIKAVIGSDFSYNIFIKDLGENQNLAEFDFTVVFDPSILSFKSYQLYGNTGTNYMGGSDNVLDWSAGYDGNNKIHLAEISWLQDFEQPKQPDSFLLVQLRFQAIHLGITPVSFEAATLGDEWGENLSAALENGSIEVIIDTPEPATVLLIGLGLIGVIALRKKFGR